MLKNVPGKKKTPNWENQHEPPVLGLHAVGLHAVLCVSPLIPYLKLHTNHMKHSRSLSTYVSSPLITLIPTSTRLTARRRLQQSPESHTHTTRFAKHQPSQLVRSSATPNSSTLRLAYNPQNSVVHAFERVCAISEPQITDQATEAASASDSIIQLSKSHQRPTWAMHRMTESKNSIVRQLILLRKTTSQLFVEGRIGSFIEGSSCTIHVAS